MSVLITVTGRGIVIHDCANSFTYWLIFQRDLIKFLHVAESKSPGEILKYKKQYDFGSYHKIIKEYDEYLDRLSKVRICENG